MNKVNMVYEFTFYFRRGFQLESYSIQESSNLKLHFVFKHQQLTRKNKEKKLICSNKMDVGDEITPETVHLKTENADLKEHNQSLEKKLREMTTELDLMRKERPNMTNLRSELLKVKADHQNLMTNYCLLKREHLSLEEKYRTMKHENLRLFEL